VIEIRIDVLPASIEQTRKAFVARFLVRDGKLAGKEFGQHEHREESESNGTGMNKPEIEASFEKLLRAKMELASLHARSGDTLLLRFTIFRDQLPLDSLPQQGWMELPVIPEEQMMETGDQVW
jgi:hypothetical protein